MLDLAGKAILALWNGVEASRVPEYNAWHTREHVPERVAIPGILGARRYVRAHGPLPEYLTLYSLETIDVLRSDPYRALLDNPTAWSRAMRPSLRDFLRIPCTRLMSAGGGLGSVVAACVLTERELAGLSAKLELQALAKKQGIVAVHMLVRDNSIPDVPFQVGGANFANAGVVLVEGYDEPELKNSLPDISDVLRASGIPDGEKTLTTYRLAYAIDRASLGRLTSVDK